MYEVPSNSDLPTDFNGPPLNRPEIVYPTEAVPGLGQIPSDITAPDVAQHLAAAAMSGEETPARETGSADTPADDSSAGEEVQLPPALTPEELTATAPYYEQLHFKELVESIKAGQPVDGVTNIENTINAQVYEVTRGEEKLILRIAAPAEGRIDEDSASEAMELRIAALQQGQGIDLFEQLVTYSLEDEDALTEPASGDSIVNLPTAIVEEITADDLRVAQIGIAAGANRRITIDGGADNIFYDPEKGFTIIDYNLDSPKYPANADKEFCEFLCGLTGAVNEMSTVEHIAAWLEVIDSGLQLLHDKNVDPFVLSPSLASIYDELNEQYPR